VERINGFWGAFQQRIARNLSDLAEKPHKSFHSIDAEMAAKGLGRSGPRIARLLEAIDQAIMSDVDWCFSEVRRLPSNATFID
jgi:hypothetical protein